MNSLTQQRLWQRAKGSGPVKKGIRNRLALGKPLFQPFFRREIFPLALESKQLFNIAEALGGRGTCPLVFGDRFEQVLPILSGMELIRELK